MIGKVHLCITAASAYMLHGILPISGPFALGCIIGTLFPDADTKSYAGFVCPLWLFSRHRGFTHSFLNCAIFSSFFMFLDYSMGIGVLLGYLLHLLADSITPMHLPYAWWPFKYTPIK